MTLSLWKFDCCSGSVPIQWSPVLSSVSLSETAEAVCRCCRPPQTPSALEDVSSAVPAASPDEYSATLNSPQISRKRSQYRQSKIGSAVADTSLA